MPEPLARASRDIPLQNTAPIAATTTTATANKSFHPPKRRVHFPDSSMLPFIVTRRTVKHFRRGGFRHAYPESRSPNRTPVDTRSHLRQGFATATSHTSKRPYRTNLSNRPPAGDADTAILRRQS